MKEATPIETPSGGTLLPTPAERALTRRRQQVAGRFGFLAFLTVFATLPFAVPALWDFVAEKLGLTRGIYLVRPHENQIFYLQMSVCVAALAYCGWRVVVPPGRVCRNTLLWIATGFMGVCVLSAATAGSPRFALVGLMMPAAGYATFLLMATMEAGRREIEKLYLAGVAGVLLLAAYGAAQSQGWDFLPYSRLAGESTSEELGMKQRVSSLFGHPNYMASYLAPMFFWCLYFAFSRFPRWMRALGVLAAVAALLAMVLGGTRGGWVAVAGGFVPFYVVLTMLPRFRRPLLFAAGLAVVCALLLLLVPNPFLSVRFDVGQRVFGSTEISARFYYWMMALEMLREHPVLGVGYGHYNVLFWHTADAFQRGADSEFFRYILREGIRGVLPGYVHNDWLQVATEQGLAGFALWAALWSVLLAQVWETARMLRNHARPLLMTATFMALFTAFALDGLFNFPLHIPVSGYLFWVSLGAWVVFRAEVAPGRSGYVAHLPHRSRTEDLAEGVPRVRFTPTRKKGRAG